MGLNLLEKKELWINHITLNNTNLTDLSHTVADVLGLERDTVLVVDVRPEHITLDILSNDIKTENIIGKEAVILERVAELPGVHLMEDAYIHSNGILGLICVEDTDEADIKGTVKRIDVMVDEMKEMIAKRVIIFPTGFELKQGLIEDTNTPYLRDLLVKNGYEATIGEIIEDDIDDMVYKLNDAVSKAFGLIITTGGVGAEDKDKSVESLLEIDPEAKTPYIVKFQQGTGRHVKDGVRIAVAEVGLSRLVSLPGPNDEVQIAADVLLQCQKEKADKKETAQRIAEALAKKLMDKKLEHEAKHWHHENHNQE